MILPRRGSRCCRPRGGLGFAPQSRHRRVFWRLRGLHSREARGRVTFGRCGGTTSFPCAAGTLFQGDAPARVDQAGAIGQAGSSTHPGGASREAYWRVQDSGIEQ